MMCNSGEGFDSYWETYDRRIKDEFIVICSKCGNEMERQPHKYHCSICNKSKSLAELGMVKKEDL